MPDGEDDEEAMRTIAALGRENAALRARLGALADEAERLAKERDALIEAMIARRGSRDVFDALIPTRNRGGCFKVYAVTETFDRKEDAVAAVRRAAGLEPES